MEEPTLEVQFEVRGLACKRCDERIDSVFRPLLELFARQHAGHLGYSVFAVVTDPPEMASNILVELSFSHDGKPELMHRWRDRAQSSMQTSVRRYLT